MALWLCPAVRKACSHPYEWTDPCVKGWTAHLAAHCLRIAGRLLHLRLEAHLELELIAWNELLLAQVDDRFARAAVDACHARRNSAGGAQLSIREQLRQALLAPWQAVLLRPMPLIDIGAILHKRRQI